MTKIDIGHHVSSVTIVVALLKVDYEEKKRAMRFAIPHIWHEPSDHHTDCYFCMVDPTKQRKEKNAPPIEYLDIASSIAPVPRDTIGLCLYHSHRQEINLVQWRQVLKILKMKVHAIIGICYVSSMLSG